MGDVYWTLMVDLGYNSTVVRFQSFLSAIFIMLFSSALCSFRLPGMTDSSRCGQLWGICVLNKNVSGFSARHRMAV